MSMCKPEIYTKTEVKFWDDEYISKQMLQAHIDPEFEGASRKLEFIEKSVEWITNLVPSKDNPSLLDLGCGPGIYDERFAKNGYEVLGVDFSKRSIEYAKQSAASHKYDIQYLYQDYLTMKLNKCFDLCTMIYCDYGALSTKDRKQILKTVYDHLKPGGKFLFDVFSNAMFEEYQESQTWEICPNGGFWRGDSHMVLNGNYKYGNNVTLKQAIVICEEEATPYYIWDTYFTKESLIKEVEAAGFHVLQIYGDIAGANYTDNSKTMSILLEK